MIQRHAASLIALATFMGSACAYAASDTVTPVMPWSISAVTVSPPPYCAAMRRYSDGSILSLSQNSQGELILALDLNGQASGISITTAYLATQNEGAPMIVLPAPARGALLRLSEPLLLDLVKHQSFSFSLDGQPRSWSGAPTPTEVRLLRLCASIIDPNAVSAQGEAEAIAAPDRSADKAPQSHHHMADSGTGEQSSPPSWMFYDQALKDHFSRLRSWVHEQMPESRQ